MGALRLRDRACSRLERLGARCPLLATSACGLCRCKKWMESGLPRAKEASTGQTKEDHRSDAINGRGKQRESPSRSSCSIF